MMNVDLIERDGIAVLQPTGELTESDFANAATIIDPYIERNGKLNGIVIHVAAFPGWESFSAMITHLKFVKAHHQKISCVAFATDSTIGSLAENIANHFVSAEIKTFSFNQLEEAKEWIRATANDVGPT